MGKPSRGRLRVFFAEFDGDDESLRAAMHAVTAAVNKTFQPKVVKLIAQEPVNGEIVQDAEVVEDSEIIEDAVSETESTGASQKPRKSKRKPPRPTLIKDLDLVPNDKQAFSVFADEKKPRTQMERVCVSVYYMGRILEIAGVTVHHVYTCFDAVGWQVPNDLPQIIRNTAHKKGWVEVSDGSDIKISTKGENYVKHNLPKVPKSE